MTVAELDALLDAETPLMECCGSHNWAKAVAAQRPFGTLERLQTVAKEIWESLEASDWLEAFSKHPKIGEKRKLSSWSSEEQSGMSEADLDVERKLFELNEAYEKQFGHIFIVCATGRSAREMLMLLEQRLNNSAETELRNAASEQAKIMKLRLGKLVSS